MKKAKQTNILYAHGITSVAFLASSLMMRGSLDLSFHDTYYVLPNSTVMIVIATLFAFFTIANLRIYLIGRRMSPMLNWIHFGLTFISIVTLILFAFKNVNAEFSQSMNEWLTVILVVFILIQLLFVANIIRAFILKKNPTSSIP